MGDYIKDFLDIEKKLFNKKLQLFGGGESDKTFFVIIRLPPEYLPVTRPLTW